MTETRPEGRVLLAEHEPTSAGHEDEREQRRPGGSHPAHVYLLPPPQIGPTRQLSWLARRLGLEHYSPKLLTQKVSIEISVLAVVLVAVFIFEFAAWSFFFNGIFAGDMGSFDVRGTTAALLLAFLFAGVILFFERQVITADIPRMQDKDRKRAQWVRVIAILGAGFIVAHSVDLLAFNVPVAKRLHAEAVQEEALRLAQDIESLGAGTGEKQEKTVTGDLDAVRDDLKVARQRRDEIVGEQERYRQQVEFLEKEVRSHREALSLAEDHLGRAEEASDNRAQLKARRELEVAHREYTEARSQLQAAIGNQGAMTARLQDTDHQIGQLTGEEVGLRNRRSTLDNQTDKISQAKETLKSRLRAWVAELERSDPGDQTETPSGWIGVSAEEKLLWPEHWRKPLIFTEPRGNFFEKIDAVYELAFGRAWKWLNSSREKRVELPSYLPAEGLRKQAPWVTYFLSFLGIHLAAIFMPFLVFAVKWFLMPKEVDAYYSAWHQAFAGDPEARVILGVEEKVRQKSEQW